MKFNDLCNSLADRIPTILTLRSKQAQQASVVGFRAAIYAIGFSSHLLSTGFVQDNAQFEEIPIVGVNSPLHALRIISFVL